MFDSHDDFEQLHDELELGGVGALALLRLLGPARQRIEFLSFFDLDARGDITFTPPHLVSNSPCRHVVIGVSEDVSTRPVPSSDTGSAEACPTSSVRLLFFVQHDAHVEDRAIDAFCTRLRPDVLLVKAAPDSLWEHAYPSSAHAQGVTEGSSTSSAEESTGSSPCPVDEAEAQLPTKSLSSKAQSFCIRRSLAPAVCSNALVVTDSSQADPTTAPQIFRDPASVFSMAFHELIQFTCRKTGEDERVGVSERASAFDKFGYGDKIFCSTGSNLKI